MLSLENVELRREGFALTANATFAQGTTAVIGPSGGGKSTLLGLIAGFAAADAGQILWNGKDIGADTPGNRPVAILFQDNNLFPHLDILTNVALGVSPVAHPSPQAMEKAAQALESVDLKGFERRKPSELSGGQQSRAALARVLLTKRPIVLLDEPFAALGPALRRDMQDLVDDLLPDATRLMVTHDPTDAQRGALFTSFVANGVVHTPQPTGALFADPPAELAAYLD